MTLDFTLSLRPIELEEVVAIGYGTVSRNNLATAVSTVSAEEISGQANASADAALQGHAPGVQVIQNAGNPGNAISVRVRGSASITANNQPLYVVDGVPVISEDLSQLGTRTRPCTPARSCSISAPGHWRRSRCLWAPAARCRAN